MMKSPQTNSTDNTLTRRQWLNRSLGLLLASALGWRRLAQADTEAVIHTFPISKTPQQWQTILTPRQYAVLREQDTEMPFTSPWLKEKRPGIFHCVGCDQALYDAATKFESGTGWPSFYQALKDAVGTQTDSSGFMIRTEVHCAQCGGHLGHVFDDGPKPTGLRHCINGVALTFKANA